MYLGKAEAICISGFYKQSVIDAARKYLLEHDGFSIWKDIYFDYKWMGWLTWKKEKPKICCTAS